VILASIPAPFCSPLSGSREEPGQTKDRSDFVLRRGFFLRYKTLVSLGVPINPIWNAESPELLPSRCSITGWEPLREHGMAHAQEMRTER
jgi:hypothetical protein